MSYYSSSMTSYDSSFVIFEEDERTFTNLSKTVRISSYTRYLERRMVGAWKKVTGLTKKQHRASYLPPNFIRVTPQKRKSIRYAL